MNWNDEGWHYRGKAPDLAEQLYAFRWALIVVLVIVNALVGFLLWRTSRGGGLVGVVALYLGGGGLALLDLVAGGLTLYAWLRRRGRR